jgi:hypothetical protein
MTTQQDLDAARTCFDAKAASSDCESDQRSARLAALMQLLRIERKYSEIAARRWRIACWVLGMHS